ncbi:MAG TPA: DUF2793 domain-containing protein [Candidatus Saccharibacteria bacterium]|nr:DUF2793 domain-containing protein [Candidatus Saccharibacteria bacterium]
MRLSFVTENTVDVASDVNQSLLEADGLIVSRVTGIETAPPAVLIDGLRVAIASGATGAFSGRDGQLGVYVENGAFWQFYSPALCIFDGVTYLSDGGDWIQSSGGEAFTLAEKQKLYGIADEATKNRADSENADKVHNHTVEQVSGLGYAATAPTVGDGVAVLRDEAYGISGSTLDAERTSAGFARSLRTKKFAMAAEGYEVPPGIPTGIAIGSGGSLFTTTYSGVYVALTERRAYVYNLPEGVTEPLFTEMYTTNNTTKNPDGTLKASSPVINLYTDKHDLHNEGQFGATPTVVRKSKGVYEITGALGLRSEGWYLDTPSDRNGNKYFNIEWTQNITPDAVDGVVDEYRDDIVVTIETFERVWNKDTGLFENGAPIDINDLQDRFVQLRFNEINVEHEDLDDETITRNQE